MLLDCANCGAPLDVKPNAWVATCAYCRRTQQVREKTKSAPPTPMGWQPPPQWTPPPTAQVAQLYVYNPGAAARKTSRLITCAVLLPVLIILGVGLLPVFLPLMRQTMSSWTWDGRSTLECNGNDSHSLKDVDVKAKATPAISVRGNCQLTIESSKIRGTEVLDVRENGRVTIRNSEITMRGDSGIRVDGNFGADIQKSKIKFEGEGDAITVLEAGGNASVKLERCELSVEAPAKAVLTLGSGNGNGHVELRDTKVTIKGGSRIVLSPGGFGRENVELHGGSIDAGGRDLFADGPYKATNVDLHGSKIVAAPQ